MWRRAGPCESHTRESYQSDKSDKSYDPNKSNESNDPNELADPDESYDSGQ